MLTRQADLALGEAMQARGHGREEVIRALLRLVTVDADGRPTRWRVRLADLAAVDAELTPFVNRRLLITDRGTETDDRAAVLEVAHEAFLSAWAPLAEAVADNSTALRARRGGRAGRRGMVDQRPPPVWAVERGQLASALSDTGAQLRPASEKYRHGVHRPCLRT